MTVEPTDSSPAKSGVADDSFADFLRRIRSGDERAAAELVERYGPAIRRAVRVRLRAPGLQRLIESVDICQSVFASFFVRSALGQYDLQSPDELLKLLAAIARNKLACQARRERAGRRDQGRVDRRAVIDECAGPDGTASSQMAAHELLEAARQRLTTEERAIFERRAQGLGWAEIAAELGGSPDALRIRLARGVTRIARQLGLDEAPDE
jgi:RNA polymerase sigma-70 factor (ECF subfamily)